MQAGRGTEGVPNEQQENQVWSECLLFCGQKHLVGYRNHKDSVSLLVCSVREGRTAGLGVNTNLPHRVLVNVKWGVPICIALRFLGATVLSTKYCPYEEPCQHCGQLP